MKFNFNINLTTIVLAIASGLFLFHHCQREKQYANDIESLMALIKDQDALLLDADEAIYKGRVAVVNANSRINALLDTIKHLKKPKVITKVVTKTKIDTVFVPYQTFVEKEIDGDIYIKTPQPFLKIDKWYTIKGTVRNNGVFFDSLIYKNDFYIATGTQDYGFFKNLFKRNETIVTIKDNNPYTSTKSLQQTIVNTPKNRWVIGPQFGVYLVDGNIRPNIGIGTTYSIIEF